MPATPQPRSRPRRGARGLAGATFRLRLIQALAPRRRDPNLLDNATGCDAALMLGDEQVLHAFGALQDDLARTLSLASATASPDGALPRAAECAAELLRAAAAADGLAPDSNIN